MKLENIELVEELINKRNVLENVLEKHKTWKNGHFEFTEHCGNAPDRISIVYFPELGEKMIDCIKNEILNIDKQLEQL